MSVAVAVAWAATFLLHSTLLIAAIWLLTRLLGMKAIAVQDRLWKVALLGALFTCTVQAGLGEHLRIPKIIIPSTSSGSSISGDRLPQPAVYFDTHRAGIAKANVVPDATATSGADPADSSWFDLVSRSIANSWPLVILLLWALGGAGFTGSLFLQLLRLRSRFRDRREITSGSAHRILRSLLSSRKRGGSPLVRLTASDHIVVPVAYGIRRPEICLPGSMLRGTAPAAMRSVLAHELAHIDRRDQLWLLTAHLVESIFFFQPLVRLARRCYQETAEFICDEEAIRQTGERVPLARTLHEMACRQVSIPTAQTTPGISGKGPPLNRRIEMILDKNRPLEAPGRARWFGPLAIALILAFALLAPGVTAFDDPPPAPAAPETDRFAPPAPPVPDVEPVEVAAVMPDIAAAPQAPEPVAPPAEPRRVAPPEPAPAGEADPALSDVEAAELAAMEEEMAAAEAEMSAEAEFMRQMELEMVAEEEAMARAEQEMEKEEELMRRMELEMAAQEEAMIQAEHEMQSEAEEMAAAEREMELMAGELASHELELARAEQDLAEKEAALDRELDALEQEMEQEDAEAGDAEGTSRDEARAREREIRRRHDELRDRHREIARERAAINKQNRDAARQQVEALRQRRAVFHSEQTALEAQRRGLERALHGIERSLDDELTEEQRARLEAMREDLGAKLRCMDEQAAVERTVVSQETVPRPEEIQ